MKRQNKVWVVTAIPPHRITLRYILPLTFCPSYQIVPGSPTFDFGYNRDIAWEMVKVLNDLLEEEYERMNEKE